MPAKYKISPAFADAMTYLEATTSNAGKLEIKFNLNVTRLPGIPTQFQDIKLIRRYDLIQALLKDEDQMVVATIKKLTDPIRADGGDAMIQKTLAAYCVPSKWRYLKFTGWIKEKE